MSSIAFARQVKTTGYGHDILFSFGTTADGEVIDFTADRVLSMNLTWAQTSAPLSTEVDETTTPFRGADLQAAAERAGISTGVFKASLGKSKLYEPIVDQHAAAVAASIDATSKAVGEDLDPDTAGKVMADALERPTGAHLRGGNIINPDGTLRAALKVPRMVIVQVLAPGEKRDIDGSPLTAKQVTTIEKVDSIDALIKAAEPVIEDLATREAIVSDILEMRDDLPLLTGLLPGADNGLAVPFPSTSVGFTQATQFTTQLRTLLPDLRLSIGRTWKRV